MYTFSYLGRAFNGSGQVVSAGSQIAAVQHPRQYTAEIVVVNARGPRPGMHAKQFRQLDGRASPREAVDHIRRLRNVAYEIRESSSSLHFIRRWTSPFQTHTPRVFRSFSTTPSAAAYSSI